MAKSKLTPEKQEQICTLIREGNYAKVAAECSGISESTFYSWLEQGQEAKSGKYLEFLESVKSAEAEAERKAVEAIADSFGADWKAAMTYLERKHPDRWGKRERHEITGEGGGAINIRVVYDDSNS